MPPLLHLLPVAQPTDTLDRQWLDGNGLRRMPMPIDRR